MSSEPKLVKNYLVTNARLESKEGMSVELLDDSNPQIQGFVKRAVLWLPLDEYKALGEPGINKRLSVQITPVKSV